MKMKPNSTTAFRRLIRHTLVIYRINQRNSDEILWNNNHHIRKTVGCRPLNKAFFPFRTSRASSVNCAIKWMGKLVSPRYDRFAIKVGWCRTAKNWDACIGPLARPFSCSLALLTHSLALHCSLRLFDHSLARSLPSLWENDLVLSHSAEVVTLGSWFINQNRILSKDWLDSKDGK